MNPNLSPAETEALLEVLHQGLVSIRVAAGVGDMARAEAIADALHNVPRLISEGHKWGWTLTTCRELFLDPLAEEFPDLRVILDPLAALASDAD